jgi:hypothetical protein
MGIDHSKIYEVACKLKPIYDEQERVFQDLLHTDCNVIAMNAQWEESVRAYQAALMESAEAVAQATNNSTGNIRMLFSTSNPLQIIWTPEDLLNVARFESFNSYAWKHPGASIRNEYAFPQVEA